MKYTYRIFNSIEEVDRPAWDRIRAQSGEAIFMDPRFLSVFEATMTDSCQYWHVVAYDESSQPVTCASLTGMTIDLPNHAEPMLASVIRRFPRILSRFRELKVLICGLPFSVGQKNLNLATMEDSDAIVPGLHQTIAGVAARSKMNLIVYKEFTDDDLPWSDKLLGAGCRRIPTLRMHCFPTSFPDFEKYCDALRGQYRKHIRISKNKID